MALCVLLSNFSSFFATSRFRSLDSETQCQENVGSTIIFVHTKIFCTVQVGKRSYQSGFLGARLAKSWGKKRAQYSNYTYYYASLTKEILNGQKGVLTTSSMMGSGLAASNWSFTLSSTANRVFTVTYSVQWYVIIAVGVCEKYSCAMTFLEAKWWQYDMMMIYFPKVVYDWRVLTWRRFGFGHLPLLQLFILWSVIPQFQLSEDRNTEL